MLLPQKNVYNVRASTTIWVELTNAIQNAVYVAEQAKHISCAIDTKTHECSISTSIKSEIKNKQLCENQLQTLNKIL